MTIGGGVMIRKFSHGGVSRSRLAASEKNAKVRSSGSGTIVSRCRWLTRWSGRGPAGGAQARRSSRVTAGMAIEHGDDVGEGPDVTDTGAGERKQLRGGRSAGPDLAARNRFRQHRELTRRHHVGRG